PLNFISGRAELLYGPAHSSGELGQFFRAEQEQHNEEEYHHVRPHKIHDTGERNRHKKFRMCLFRKKVVQRSSTHTELADVYSQKMIARRPTSLALGRTFDLAALFH